MLRSKITHRAPGREDATRMWIDRLGILTLSFKVYWRSRLHEHACTRKGTHPRSKAHTHAHTHTHIYIYIHVFIHILRCTTGCRVPRIAGRRAALVGHFRRMREPHSDCVTPPDDPSPPRTYPKAPSTAVANSCRLQMCFLSLQYGVLCMKDFISRKYCCLSGGWRGCSVDFLFIDGLPCSSEVNYQSRGVCIPQKYLSVAL